MTPLNFVSPSAKIGLRTVIWHFCTILADVVIGDDCSVGSGTEIGTGSTVGDKTRISAHVFIPYHSTIGHNVFIGPGVIFTDDRKPKVLNPGERYTAEPPVIEDYVSIGAGAVILPGVRIGHHAKVAAGAIVARDVDPYTLVKCERAKVHQPSRATESWVRG